MNLLGCLWVGVGGFVGAASRYLIAEWIGKPGGFPFGTLAVNLIGCLLIGLLAGLRDEMRLLVVIGFLGGFTTYSSFGLDAVNLLREEPLQAFAYVGVHVVLGLGAVWVGLRLAG